MLRPLAALALLLETVPAFPAVAQAVKVVGCPEGARDPAPALMPLKPGPMTLSGIYCLNLPGTSFPRSPPQPSPDGRNFFIFDSVTGLTIGGMHDGTRRLFEGRLTALIPYNGTPFAWSRDSRKLWGVRQDTAPAGWSLGPVRPTLFATDGTDRPLPALTHPAGPLDQLFWTGDGGRALAVFGSKGNLYKPEHRDLRPTIAFVDARTGKILQSIAIADIVRRSGHLWVDRVVSVVDRHGRAHALIPIRDQWIHWMQGQAPRVLPVQARRSPSWIALTPDGRRLLEMRGLSATGMICEHNPKCPPPEPQSGVVAELRDLPSGKIAWSISGTAKTFSGADTPAISPDGRYALISMPARTDGRSIVLVAMKTGAVLQEIPAPWTSECTLGFSPDGKFAWIGGGSQLATYRIQTGKS